MEQGNLRSQALRNVLIEVSKLSSKEYLEPLTIYVGAASLSSNCEASGLIGLYGRLFPFFLWVNLKLGWSEKELREIISLGYGQNSNRKGLFSSNEIRAELEQMANMRNGMPSQKARNFANKIIWDCKNPQQRIGWVMDKPDSLD
jgi:hypothetical protein